MENEKPKRATIRLSKETVEWLDAQPRDFNFSKFADEAITNKRSESSQRGGLVREQLRKGLVFEDYQSLDQHGRPLIVFDKSPARLNDEMLSKWHDEELLGFLKRFYDDEFANERFKDVKELKRWLD